MVAQANEKTPSAGLGTRLLEVLRLREASIAGVAILVAVIFQIINSAFLSVMEIQVLLAAAAQYGLIAIGEALLMITGEIDLSAAKIYSTVPFIAYYLNQVGVPLWAGILIALAGGALIGMANGLITVLLGVPSLIGTLGMQFFLNGATLWVTHSEPVVTPKEGALNTFLGLGQTDSTIGGLSTYAGFIWLVIAAVVLTVVLLRTRFGLHTVSVGSNLLAAREIGIRTARVKVANFMIMGVLAGFCGIIQAISSGSIDPSAGDNTLTLYAIAAAVIGGTSLFGGSGTVIGAVLGAFVISSLNNGLPLIGAQAGVSDTVLGLAIVASMVLNIRLGQLRTRRRAR
jgi:simple sugar transport system permease protein